MIFTFTIPTDKYADPQEAISTIYPLMSFIFQCMERIKRLRISKEAKIKAEKNRLRVEEAFLKTTHAARAEAAAARKEEKKKLEKERILKVKWFCILFFYKNNYSLLKLYYLGGPRETTKVGGERDETSTEEKGTKNETIKSKVYVKDKTFLVFCVFNCWSLVTTISS